MKVGPFEAETIHRGTGRPVLLIHGVNPIHAASPFLAKLAMHGEVIAPSHPGFGGSALPPDFDTMYDLVNFYLSVLDTIPSDDVTVIGFSFGGWIAAELAVTRPRSLGRLVLVDPVGIKIGGREERDIVHFFNTDPAELNRRSWHDPSRRPSGIYGLGWQATISDAMTDQEMITLARNWDSLCLFAWRPHMYNPRLKDWLHRIDVPTQVIWGEADRIVTPDYGRAFAALIPDARFIPIKDAGHHPELERPDAFVDAVVAFQQETRQ
jgi:pimeloyl-ACP methyl ester carboxylesterase